MGWLNDPELMIFSIFTIWVIDYAILSDGMGSIIIIMRILMEKNHASMKKCYLIIMKDGN